MKMDLIGIDSPLSESVAGVDGFFFLFEMMLKVPFIVFLVIFGLFAHLNQYEAVRINPVSM